MSWSNCDSYSSVECLNRVCKYAELLYFIDEGTPVVKCNKPNNKWVKKQ